MSNFIIAVFYAIIILGCIFISWAITAGVVWLVCLCFGLTFKWAWATGVWLILTLIKCAF